jgi:hypothetical protein
MNHAPTDVLLERMFVARAVVLVTAALLVGLMACDCLAECLFSSYAAVRIVVVFAAVWTTPIILGGSAFVWYYLYRVGLNEAGPKYAIGHLLVCVALTPVLLIGIVFLPLLVSYDVERWAESNGNAMSHDSEHP